MDNANKTKVEKLQTKLDKLLQAREKKQKSFDKTKQEISIITKEIDGVKLKLFEILQSGSDDSAFSDWVKQKINEKGENEKSVKTEMSEVSVLQSHQLNKSKHNACTPQN